MKIGINDFMVPVETSRTVNDIEKKYEQKLVNHDKNDFLVLVP